MDAAGTDRLTETRGSTLAAGLTALLGGGVCATALAVFLPVTVSLASGTIVALAAGSLVLRTRPAAPWQFAFGLTTLCALGTAVLLAMVQAGLFVDAFVRAAEQEEDPRDVLAMLMVLGPRILSGAAVAALGTVLAGAVYALLRLGNRLQAETGPHARLRIVLWTAAGGQAVLAAILLFLSSDPSGFRQPTQVSGNLLEAAVAGGTLTLLAAFSLSLGLGFLGRLGLWLSIVVASVTIPAVAGLPWPLVEMAAAASAFVAGGSLVAVAVAWHFEGEAGRSMLRHFLRFAIALTALVFVCATPLIAEPMAARVAGGLWAFRVWMLAKVAILVLLLSIGSARLDDEFRRCRSAGILRPALAASARGLGDLVLILLFGVAEVLDWGSPVELGAMWLLGAVALIAAACRERCEGHGLGPAFLRGAGRCAVVAACCVVAWVVTYLLMGPGGIRG